jgi:CBS-domain-containing membrane protein
MCGKEKSPTNFYDIKVKDIMVSTISEIPRVNETAEMTQVLSSMKNKDHVWVMDSAEPTHLLGVITQSDTFAFFSPPLTSSLSFENPDPRSIQYGVTITAEEIMSKKPVTASLNETMREILVKMKEQKIKHLPVVDDHDQLIGELSLTDIIQIYSKHFNQNQREKIETS